MNPYGRKNGLKDVILYYNTLLISRFIFYLNC